MYLVFDTETTGLPRNWNAPTTDLNNWPRIVQLAWQFYDEAGGLLMEADHIIRPDGFIIPGESTMVHGISTEKALREGIGLKEALLEFADILSLSSGLVAHNISFDERIVGAEFIRTDLPRELINQVKKICTMEWSVEYCKLPGGPRGYKYPNLNQLHNCLFGQGFDGAHNALVDVQACARCFFEMKKQGIIVV
jgi:DNA polymerase III epsilon subunit-like protein